MAMFMYDENKVVLKPDNASPAMLSHLLQCKAVGMILLDQTTGEVYPYPGNPNRPFHELVTPGPFLVISGTRLSESSEYEDHSSSLGFKMENLEPRKSPTRKRQSFKNRNKE